MRPEDVHIRYILDAVDRATRAVLQVDQTIRDSAKRTADQVTAQGKREQDSHARTAASAVAGQRDQQQAYSATDQVRKGIIAGLRREVRAVNQAGGAYRSATANLRDLNTRFQAFRNLLYSLRWPAVVTGIGLMTQGLGAAAAAAVELTGALSGLSGIVAGLPAMFTAFGQGAGTLALGFNGVEDALKALEAQQVKGITTGARAADQAERQSEQVRNAENRYRDAVEASQKAQEKLTEARRQARRELIDLALAAEGAGNSERRAQLAVQQAFADMQATMADPTASQRARDDARLTYEEALTGAKSAGVEAKRAQQDFATANREGAKGMDTFKNAQEAARDAMRAQREAAHDLKVTQREAAEGLGTSDAAAEKVKQTMAQLGPEAQNFVKYIFSLRPEFSKLSDIAGAGIFPGLTAGIQSLMTNLPVVQTIVGDTSQVFGDLFRDLGAMTADPAFGQVLKDVGATNVEVFKDLADGVRELAPAFVTLIDAAQPLLEFLGDLAKDWATAFGDMIAEADRNGGLADYFQRTIDTIQQVVDTLAPFGETLINVLNAAWGPGMGLLGMLEDIGERFADFTGSAEGENRMATYFANVQPNIEALLGLVGDLGGMFIRLSESRGVADLIEVIRDELLPVIEDTIIQTTNAFGPGFIRLLADLLGMFQAMQGPMSMVVSVLGDFADAAGWLIENVPGLKEVLGVLITLTTLKKVSGIFGDLTGLNKFKDGTFKIRDAWDRIRQTAKGTKPGGFAPPKAGLVAPTVSTVAGTAGAVVDAADDMGLMAFIRANGNCLPVRLCAAQAAAGAAAGAGAAGAGGATAIGSDPDNEERKRTGKPRGRVYRGRFLAPQPGEVGTLPAGTGPIRTRGARIRGALRLPLTAAQAAVRAPANIVRSAPNIVRAAPQAARTAVTAAPRAVGMLGRIGGGIAAGAGRLGVGGALALGRGALGLAGGPIGIALMVAPLIIQHRKAIMKALTETWDAVKKATVVAWNAVKGAVGDAWKWIKGAFSDAAGWIGGAAKSVWDALKSAYSTVFRIYTTPHRLAWRWIKGAFSDAKGWIKGAANDVKEALSGAWGGVKDRLINPLRDGIENAVDFLKRAPGKIKDGAMALGRAFIDFIKDGFRAAGDLGKALLKFVAAAIDKALPNSLGPINLPNNPLQDRLGLRGGGWVVPGDPNRDGTLAMLAGDEVVLTGDGQAMMHAAAPGLLDSVVADQLPHFARGGAIAAAKAGRRAGWSGGTLMRAVAISGGESFYEGRPWNPRARLVTPQEDSRGLWQINTYAHPWALRAPFGDLYDRDVNARAAHRIWKDAGGGPYTFGPWSQFTNRGYTRYLEEASEAVRQVGDNPNRTGSDSGKTIKQPTGPGSLAADPLTGLLPGLTKREQRIITRERNRTMRMGLVDRQTAIDRGRQAALDSFGRRGRAGHSLYMQAVREIVAQGAQGRTDADVATKDQANPGRPSRPGSNRSRTTPRRPRATDYSGTPRQVLDRLVLPIGRRHGLMTASGAALNSANVAYANSLHRHLGSASDHAGPGSLKWAVDMSGGGILSSQMHRAADALAEKFGISKTWPYLSNASTHGLRFQLIHGANFPEPTGDHRDHVHLGVRKLRRGGFLSRYKAGKSRTQKPHKRPVAGINAPNAGLFDAAPAALRTAGRSQQAQTAFLLTLGAQLEGASAEMIGSVQDNLESAIRVLQRHGVTTKEAEKIALLRSAIDMTNVAAGAFLGGIENTLNRAQQQFDKRAAAAARSMRVRDVDPSSAAGLGEVAAQNRDQQQFLADRATTLRAAIKRAQKAGLGDQVAALRTQLNQTNQDLKEAQTVGVETTRQMLVAGYTEFADSLARQGEQMGADASRAMRTANIDPSSAEGQRRQLDVLTGQKGLLETQRQALESTISQLPAGGASATQLQRQLEDLNNQIAENVVQQVEAYRAAVRANAREAVEKASGNVALNSIMQQRLQIQQGLNRTADTAGARVDQAAFITGTIVPGLENERSALQGELQALKDTAATDAEIAAKEREVEQKTNDIMQAQLDAQNLIEENTRAAAEALKDFQGSVGFEHRGQGFTDLIAFGTGA